MKGSIQGDLRVYFEDPNLIVLEKPAGLLSQGEHTGDENLVEMLRVRFGRPYVGLVHRLDRNSSGIMVVAKRTKAARRLTEALQDGRLIRQYLAWVHGSLNGAGRWMHELRKDERTNSVTAVRAPQAGSKAAVLTFQVAAHGSWHDCPLTLLELTLETGRSHQIRAQAAEMGHPLLGDSKYARGLAAAAERANRAFGRPALHSHRIEFPHPIGGSVHRYVSPLPPDMADIPLARR